jgi:glucokinase
VLCTAALKIKAADKISAAAIKITNGQFALQAGKEKNLLSDIFLINNLTARHYAKNKFAHKTLCYFVIFIFLPYDLYAIL